MATPEPLTLAERLGPADASREDGGCVMYVWRPHPRVIVIEPQGIMDGPITEWGLAQMSEVLQANLDAGRKIYVVWNLEQVRSYRTSVRRLCIEWFREHSVDLNRHLVLLPPSSLVRMAISIAGALGIELTRHMYSDEKTFLRVLDETLTYLREQG